WTPISGVPSYTIYRDGSSLANVSGSSFVDFSPPAGQHEYCIESSGPNGLHGATKCCHSAYTLPATPTCAATRDLPGMVKFSWSDVANESGYRLYRDAQVLTELPPDDTVYVDSVLGPHGYCVEAFNDGGKSFRCCETGKGLDFPATAIRLSWGTCSPQVP